MWRRRTDRGYLLPAVVLILIASAVIPACRRRPKGQDPIETPKAAAPVKILYPTTPGSFVKLVDRLKPSVVHLFTDVTVKGGPADWFPSGKTPQSAVLSEMANRMQKSLGTGFIVDATGHVLTNEHIIAKAEKIFAQLHDGTKVRVKVVGKDDVTDHALLQLELPADVKVKAARLGDSDALQPGEWVFALGNPFGRGTTISAGVVSAKESSKEIGQSQMGRAGYWGFIQTDVAINAGNSGGPLCNTVGEVVGISTAVEVETHGLGFAVPIDLVEKLRPTLEREGRVVRAWVGIYAVPVTAKKAEELGLPKSKGTMGALVQGVLAGPAQIAGLKAGDIILEFGRRPVTRAGDLPWLTSLAGVNRQVEVKVWRDGRVLSFTVKTAAMPE